MEGEEEEGGGGGGGGEEEEEEEQEEEEEEEKKKYWNRSNCLSLAFSPKQKITPFLETKSVRPWPTIND